MPAPSDATLEPSDIADFSNDRTHYELTLFVSGASDLSARAIGNARVLCELHLSGRYNLAVVDVHDDPAAATNRDVVAVPTLIRYLPLPVRRLVGDLSDSAKVLEALDLPSVNDR